jgi:uncharacterized membrane protein
MALTEKDYKLPCLACLGILVLSLILMAVEVIGRFVFNNPISIENMAVGIGFTGIGLALYSILSIIRINKALNIKNL